MKDKIKQQILQILENENCDVRKKYLSIERLIIDVMTMHVKSQNKTMEIEPYRGCHMRYDAYFPDGFDEFLGETALEIKLYGRNFRHRINEIVGRIYVEDNTLKNLIIVIVGNLTPDAKEELQNLKYNKTRFSITIWDIDNLAELFLKYEKYFEEIYKNINALSVKQAVTKAIHYNKDSYKKKREQYIKELAIKYNDDDLVLVLGAGASAEAQIATWDDLISELFVVLIDKELTENGIVIDESAKEKLISEIKKQNENSPLLQTRFIKQGIEKEFEKIVGEVLYKKVINYSPLLERVGQLCVSKRGKYGVKAIINYNFDDLVEQTLEKKEIPYRSVYTDGVIPEKEEIGIYHVHGFLPRKKEGYEKLTESLLVFSEEGYHKLMLEPYNWANIVQLSSFMNNTCLFIGLSMTDPNLRRLLDVAAQKDADGICRHYAIMKRMKIKQVSGDEIEKFEQINDELQESFYGKLGVNVIWVDDYKEIPELLREIRCRRVD